MEKENQIPVDQLVSQVFDNDMLREMIVNRVINSNRGFPTNTKPGLYTIEDVKNCRLVSKAWMESISILHKRRQRPLFHLKLTVENSSGLSLAQNSTPCKQNETLIRKFISATEFWNLKPRSRSFPPFHFKLTPSFFKIANAYAYHEVFTFLEKFGSKNMVSFTFHFFRTKLNHIPTVFPDFEFVNLRQVSLIIERLAWSFIPLIRTILESSPSLEYLDLVSATCVVAYSNSHMTDVIDKIASNRPYTLQLPNSTKKIVLSGTADSCSCFYSVPVDNLNKLETLTLSASSCITHQIRDMLVSSSRNLVNLNLIGFTSCAYAPSHDNLLELASMKRLRSLTFNLPWVMKPGSWFSYSWYLPVLKELKMVHSDPDMYHLMLLNQRSETVEKCRAVLVQPHIYTENGHRSTSPRMDATKTPLLQTVQKAFPNLTYLEMGVNGCYSLALEYIFMYMTNLKGITLFIEASSRFLTTIHWDAVFTGLSPTACKAMYDNPNYWNDVELIDERYNSIRKLKNLQALYIVETTYPACRAFGTVTGSGHTSCNFENENLPVIDYSFSDMSFHFSFLRMRALKNIVVTKGFLPSEFMQKKWVREKGTQIKTIKSPKLYHLIIDKFSVGDATWYLN